MLAAWNVPNSGRVVWCKFGVGGACGEGFDIILAAKSGDGPCEGVLNGEDCCAVFF